MSVELASQLWHASAVELHASQLEKRWLPGNSHSRPSIAADKQLKQVDVLGLSVKLALQERHVGAVVEHAVQDGNASEPAIKSNAAPSR